MVTVREDTVDHRMAQNLDRDSMVSATVNSFPAATKVTIAVTITPVSWATLLGMSQYGTARRRNNGTFILMVNQRGITAA